MRRFSLLAAPLLLLAAPAASHAATQTSSYAGFGFATQLPAMPPPAPDGWLTVTGACVASAAGRIGAANACFPRARGATRVALTITDAVFGRIGGFYVVNDGRGEPIARGTFCGTKTLAMPAGGESVYVAGDSPATATRCGTPGFATTGTMTAVWS